jgi:predicted Zn-dependent protease
MPEPSSTNESRRQVGFGHTKKRIAVEVAILIGGGLALLGILLWLVRSLAGLAVHWLPASFDESIGRPAWASMAPDTRRCTNPRLLEYVRGIARPLLETTKSPFEFRFTVVDDSAVNAYALPGGFVTVNTGLLDAADSGEEVAAVLAHELAHVTERHGTQRVLRQLGTVALISLVFGGGDLEKPAELAGSLASSAYDRDQEAEADRVGLATLQGAGIDPAGMARFFERVSASAGAQIPAFLSTHPDPGDRAERARAAAQAAPATTKLPAPPSLNCHGT